jgi:hypothetical protein
MERWNVLQLQGVTTFGHLLCRNAIHLYSLRASINLNVVKNVLFHIYPLLGNDRETNETMTIATQKLRT